MTCDEFEARLTAFSLGELGPDETGQAREHVAGCSACASSVLRDRQLTALLRASVVEMPSAGRQAVLAAVRAEARRTGDQAEPGRPAAHRWSGAAAAGSRSGGRRRHWLALSSAAGLAAAVLAAVVLAVPAPDPGSPLAAGWSAYRTEASVAWDHPGPRTTERLLAVLGAAARTPDLTRFGLTARGWGARELAGHLAAVAEYRDGQGRRVTLLRWRGKLPEATQGSPAQGYARKLQTATWGETTSVWFRSGEVVWCLIGTVDQPTLDAVAAYLGAES
jgi:anti-sigma factor RsiW